VPAAVIDTTGVSHCQPYLPGAAECLSGDVEN